MILPERKISIDLLDWSGNQDIDKLFCIEVGGNHIAIMTN